MSDKKIKRQEIRELKESTKKSNEENKPREETLRA